MAGPIRFRDPGVAARLLGEGHRFEFFQAVRLLRLQQYRRQVRDAAAGGLAPPAGAVRFRTALSLAFPASEIQSATRSEQEEAPTELTVNFMGLTGPSGVLPRHYTEWLIARQVEQRDGSAHAFFDLFNHRLIDLFYQAWEKHRCHIGFERDGNDRLTRAVRDLVGVGFQSLQRRLSCADDTCPPQALLYYSGVLNQRPLAADTVARLLAEYFSVPVRVQQFLPSWLSLADADQTRLGQQRAQLGSDAVVGERMLAYQARLRVRIGPLTRAQYRDFLPGGRAHAALKALLQFCWGLQYALEVQLQLRRADVAGSRLGDADSPLGWCGWLQSGPPARDADDACFALT